MTLLLKGMWRNIVRGNKFRQQTIASTNLCSSVEPSRRAPDTTTLALRSSESPSDVLVAVQRHLPTMTHKHLLIALRTLFEMQKGRSPTTDIIRDPAFGVLCQNLKKHSRNLDVNELIESVKILTYLQLPVDSFIVQTLLQLLRCNINDINIRQVMFLNFLLQKYSGRNHLIDALSLALPLVFQIHLPLEIDQEDLPLLKEMLAFACHKNLPDRCINNIVTGILLHFDNIDVLTAKSVIWSLCEGNCTQEIYPTRAKLLDLCFDIFSQNINELTYEDVLRTTAKIKSRIVEKHPEFYNERFMDAVAEYVIKSQMEFIQGFLIARSLSRIAHTNLGLVDYLCQIAASDPDTLSKCQPNMLFGFINCLANHNYTPEPTIWEEIVRQINENQILSSSNIALPWTKFSLESAALGYYNDRVLKRVFSEEFLNEYLHRTDNTLDYLQLLTLLEAVRAFHSNDYNLPSDVLKTAKGLYPIHSVTDHVGERLAKGLGGEEFVAKNVVLNSGMIADIVICIENGKPLKVAVEDEQNKIPIDNLKLPESALIICIMNFNQGCYSMNSNRLRGTFRLIIDIIEKQGYALIPLNITQWINTPEKEQTPYLMREVSYKCKETGVKLAAV